MCILHLPESFALPHQLANLWRLNSGMLRELYWLTILNMAYHHRNLLRWSDQKKSGGTEGEETRKVVSRCAVSPGKCICSHVLLTYHLKHWLPSEMSDSTPSPTTFATLGPKWHLLLFPKLKEFMKGWERYLQGKWLARRPRSTIHLQRNPSFGEMLD